MYSKTICILLGTKCPRDYPYAFMWGAYCCKTKYEDKTNDGIQECDNSVISLSSVCCNNDEYLSCPAQGGCKDRKGNTLLTILWISLKIILL